MLPPIRLRRRRYGNQPELDDYVASRGTSSLLDVEHAKNGRLFLVGEIDEESTEKFLKLLEISKRSDAPEIVVYITSMGGSVFESFAIYDALRSFSKSVTTVGFGVCASGAAIALQGGSIRAMSNRSWLMLHEPYSHVEGPASTIKDEAEIMHRITKIISDVFSERGKLPQEQIVDMLLRKEVWITAGEAKEYGFIDVVLGGKSRKRRRR